MKQPVVSVAVCCLLASAAPARDRVVLQPPDRPSPLAISGDIADYTAEEIEIHLTVGKPVHRYPAADIVTVETVKTESHRAGVAAVADGDLDEATRLLEQAVTDEPRAWMQREILGWLVKIALRQGDRSLAGRRFLQIISSTPVPREYAVIPLVWETEPINSRLQQHGRMWLTGQTDVERLLGASALLLDQRFSETARTELDRLARSGDGRVAALARAQLWRLRIAASDLSDRELASWEQTIAGLPAELRAGPYFLLGRAALHRSEYDRAAAAFLWLLTVHADNETLAAQAGLSAATALKRTGRHGEARRVLDELTTRYHWSPAAAEARTLLDELESES